MTGAMKMGLGKGKVLLAPPTNSPPSSTTLPTVPLNRSDQASVRCTACVEMRVAVTPGACNAGGASAMGVRASAPIVVKAAAVRTGRLGGAANSIRECLPRRGGTDDARRLQFRGWESAVQQLPSSLRLPHDYLRFCAEFRSEVIAVSVIL